MPPEIPAIEAIRRVHLIAVAGTGMGTLACMLADRGFSVTGSDIAAYPPMGDQLRTAGIEVQKFLKQRNAAWNLVGRVHFNLAENRRDEEAPFAFMATYTTRLSAAAKAQHLPLGKALKEYAGAKNRDRLLSLLMPVQRAAEHCTWLKAMVESGEIYHPLRWNPSEALQFLKDVPLVESAGVVVRMPASWHMNRPARPQVRTTVGAKAPSQLGLDAVLERIRDLSGS